MRPHLKGCLISVALSLVICLSGPLEAAPYLIMIPPAHQTRTTSAASALPNLQAELEAWDIPAEIKKNLSHIGCTQIELAPSDVDALRTVFPGALVVPGDLKLKASYTGFNAASESKDAGAQATPWHTGLTASLLQTARESHADFAHVFIGVLDSGISGHPAFGNRIRYDLARNTLDSRDGDGANPTDLTDVTDLHGHGTAVTGVIAGDVTGVCPEVDIIPVRIANADAMADFSDMAEGIDYLVGLKRSGKLPADSHLIVNLSYNTLEPLADSDPDAEAAFRNMIETAAAYRVLFVASSGNNGADIDSKFVYPTSLFNENLVSVAAVNQSDRLASFSNFGVHTVEIAAPGESIVTTTRSGGTGIWNGTSFAAPFSAGVAAILWALHPELDDIQIRNVLINATDAQRFLPTTAGASTSISVMAGDCMNPSELTDNAFVAAAAGSAPITGNETVDFVPDDSGTGDTGGVAGGGGGCNAASIPLQAVMLLPLSLLLFLKKS